MSIYGDKIIWNVEVESTVTLTIPASGTNDCLISDNDGNPITLGG
jgi:hypothetical protein